MSYSLDAELAPWAAMLPRRSLDDVEAARASLNQMAAMQEPYQARRPLKIADRSTIEAAGRETVAVRIYAPADADNPLPCLLFFHGGAFVVGNLDLDNAVCARLADELDIVVVAVDYRLAPEHPFPAGLEDCYTALTWVVESAEELGIDPDRLGVAGASAGGGLAAAIALLARDRGGPRLCFQCLWVPELDDRLDSPSMSLFVDTPMWSRPQAVQSWNLYLGDATPPGSDNVSVYAAPSRAEDLSGLPAAYVSVCEFDPLRDEGLLFANRLAQAGVSTELHLWPGTFHGSERIVPDAVISQRMQSAETDAIRRGLRVKQL